MFFRKRIAFAIALISAVCVTGICFVTLTRGRSVAAAPIRVRVLRRKDRKQDKPTAAEVSLNQTEDERKLKVKEFKDMPLAIKEVRNLQSATWYKDLEIEVKNISSKPIYSVLAYLKFPDVNADPHRVSGITMEFGLDKYIDIRVIGNPADPRVNPGETCVLRIDEQYWAGLRWKQEHAPERVKKFELKFGVISFGDQTGFAAESPRDYKEDKSRSLHHSKTLRPPPQNGCGSCGRLQRLG